MRTTRLFFSFLVSLILLGSLNAQESFLNDQAQEHILKVMSEYKNPFAYYPFNRDLFLPTEEEIMKTELKHSYPENANVIGPFIFMKPGAELDRELFVDARGRPMFQNFLSNKRPASLKSDYSYFRGRQRRLQSAYPNLGKFLLFNKGFLEAN